MGSRHVEVLKVNAHKDVTRVDAYSVETLDELLSALQDVGATS